MISLIEQNRAALEQLCRDFHVQKLEIFGSATDESRFDLQKSDLDFLVEFLPLQPGEYADAYFGLLEALQDLFDRNIDLVMPKAIKNPYFLIEVNRERKLIYAP